MCKRVKTTILMVFLGALVSLFAVTDFHEDTTPVPSGYMLGFYNVENLFDTEDDPRTHDNEYLPDRGKKWDDQRYQKKLDMLARVILAMKDWEGPDVLGLCEVENKTVLDDLIHQTNLETFGYSIVHRDSKDRRGIDVALLYKHNFFKVAEVTMLKVPLPDNKPTRDIMAVKGLLKGDTTDVFLFINHWPSRWGGEVESAPKRVAAAKVLRMAIDSVQSLYESPQIVVMGDFNDDPDDASLSNYLNAEKCGDEYSSKSLCNLSFRYVEQDEIGSLKFQHQWHYFDQIMVSGNLLDDAGMLTAKLNTAEIFHPDWLMADDDKFGGKQPFRTYSGPYYTGGYSDHFPVSVMVEFNAK